MCRHYKSFLLVLFFYISLQTYAQPGGNFDSLVGNKIIFQDNFKNDSIGQFPSGWFLDTCQYFSKEEHLERFWQVEKDGDQFMISSQAMGQQWNIIPDIPKSNYLPDSFVIELDFTLMSENGCGEICFATDHDPCYKTEVHVNHWVGVTWILAPFVKDTRPYPGIFDSSVWHHLMMIYNRKRIYGYLDHYLLRVISDCGFIPHSFGLHCVPPIKYKNIKVFTDWSENVFNKLLTDNKFTTHAILFDVNKSFIKPESIDFIKQLAAWLKENRTIKLEIDGHTDNDGDAAANMKLSQDRADEVKKQLVLLGIDGSRLTANGYGATKPLQSNTTLEGKAENRRVEFIKK